METIKLENDVFEGRNCIYLLGDGDSLTLVDTGVSMPDIDRQFRSQLAERGYTVEDVERVLLTHWHPDHAGLAGTIQRESGATVHAHSTDAPLITRELGPLERMRERQREKFHQWGMPDEKVEELLSVLDEHDEMGGERVSVTEFESGDIVQGGDCELHARHAPGHTAGLSCFEFETAGGEREAFVGDAVLPVYTPNIGGADVRVDDPLGKYLATLRAIADRGYDRVWPGHREVITNPTSRAMEIIDHHRDRAVRTYEVLRKHGPATAWEVSGHLFGALEGIHVMHGPGEAYAHVDHMERRGLVTVEDGEYRVDPTVERNIDDLVLE